MRRLSRRRREPHDAADWMSHCGGSGGERRLRRGTTELERLLRDTWWSLPVDSWWHPCKKGSKRTISGELRLLQVQRVCGDCAAVYILSNNTNTVLYMCTAVIQCAAIAFPDHQMAISYCTHDCTVVLSGALENSWHST